MASTIFKTKFTKNKKLATFRMVLTPSENIKNKEQTKLTKAIKRKTFSKDLFFKVVTPFLNIIIKGYHNQFKNRKLIPQSSAINEWRDKMTAE
ncbi:hypothetical protein, partial [uncultured Enterococcus sp.]|uniref:hypothetical protein n=1 Tax=uncultured Enterococcus sp. TaxID=167972 RepID=UPI0028EB9427